MCFVYVLLFLVFVVHFFYQIYFPTYIFGTMNSICEWNFLLNFIFGLFDVNI